VHFVSLRSSFDYENGQPLSRVEMNALGHPRQPLEEIQLALSLDLDELVGRELELLRHALLPNRRCTKTG
jgi:hypothetical protein